MIALLNTSDQDFRLQEFKEWIGQQERRCIYIPNSDFTEYVSAVSFEELSICWSLEQQRVGPV